MCSGSINRDLLITITNHIAAKIDKVKAYKHRKACHMPTHTSYKRASMTQLDLKQSPFTPLSLVTRALCVETAER